MPSPLPLRFAAHTVGSMIVFASLLGGLAALAFATGVGDASPARRQPGESSLRLELRLAPEETSRAPALLEPSPAPALAPPCLGDYCAVRVEVPGFATRFRRPSRTELVSALLDRSGIEPFATIAWLFVATGVRVDWSPPAYDAAGGGADGRGWGSVFVQLKLRVDAMNHPMLPQRHRARASRSRSWRALIAPRA